jgi:hypothetical protein
VAFPVRPVPIHFHVIIEGRTSLCQGVVGPGVTASYGAGRGGEQEQGFFKCVFNVMPSVFAVFVLISDF